MKLIIELYRDTSYAPIGALSRIFTMTESNRTHESGESKALVGDILLIVIILKSCAVVHLET